MTCSRYLKHALTDWSIFAVLLLSVMAVTADSNKSTLILASEVPLGDADPSPCSRYCVAGLR